ncbi:MAG: NAD-dependent epimerase/dehydratase family protein [Desulfomonilaceae bacterium]
MKIAVTGASGFIGRHVLAELRSHQVEVIAVTRNASRLVDLGGRIRIVEYDIDRTDPHCFDKLGRPDVLIHLAWDGLPNYKSLHHFETELPRQYRFLKAMLEAGLHSLLVTGTCFEYGMRSGPLSEDMDTRPSNPYGYAKDALRKQLMFLKTNYPFNLTWARLFYMYGDGQPKAALYPQLKEAVSRKDRVFNMSGGQQLRDYLPVSEVARFIVELAKRRSDTGVVNVCSGKPISVRNLVESWLKENSWEIELNLGYYPYPDYEPMAFWGDRRRLNSILESR